MKQISQGLVIGTDDEKVPFNNKSTDAVSKKNIRNYDLYDLFDDKGFAGADDTLWSSHNKVKNTNNTLSFFINSN